MTETLAATLFFITIIVIVSRMIKILGNRKELYLKPDGTKEWNEVKFGGGFVILSWDELKQWDSLTEKQKANVATAQQKMIKNGICKIVLVGDEKRLVSAQNFKQVKNEQRKR
jgi:hypothetical protein